MHAREVWAALQHEPLLLVMTVLVCAATPETPAAPLLPALRVLAALHSRSQPPALVEALCSIAAVRDCWGMCSLLSCPH